MKQVFWISGARGFVGSSLIQALKEQNSTVYEMRILQLGLQIIDPFSKQVYRISYSSHRPPLDSDANTHSSLWSKRSRRTKWHRLSSEQL